MSVLQVLAPLVPLLLGTHLAAYFHGKAAGIRASQELRRALGITHYVVTEHKSVAEGDEHGS